MNTLYKLGAVITLFITCCSSSVGQDVDTWDLRRCIDYATSNNIEVQRSQLGVKSQKVYADQAFMNRLPGITANVSNSTNWGRTYDQNNSSINDVRSNSTSLSVGANISLFNSFKLVNAERLQALKVDAARINNEIVKDDISLKVANAFVNLLLNKEVENLYQLQIDVVEKQFEKVTVRYDAGAGSKSELLELKSERTRLKAQLTEAELNTETVKISLQQIMNYPVVSPMEITMPELPELKAGMSLKAAEEVFVQALPRRPEIKWADLELRSSEIEMEMAKADYYPSLGASAGYNNFYNDLYPGVLSDQLEKNESKSVGLRLSIPIFNRHQARNSVKLAKLQIEDKQKQLELEKQNLRNTIQNAWVDAANARERYLSQMEVLNQQQELFQFSEERFELGDLASLDLNIQRSRLMAVEVEVLQAKYQFIFSTKVLEFYVGKPLEL